MGIALFTIDGLFAPLQAALDWMARVGTPRPLPAVATSPVVPAVLRGRRTRPAAVQRGDVRRLSGGPVRVLRVVDAQAPADPGRLVISGRMADVCAELDRLAGLEPLARRTVGTGSGLSAR